MSSATLLRVIGQSCTNGWTDLPIVASPIVLPRRALENPPSYPCCSFYFTLSLPHPPPTPWRCDPTRARAYPFRGLQITHKDALQSVRLLWTSDQLVAETSTWQHTTLTTDRHPCHWRDSNPQPSRRAAEDPRLRPRGHWDRRSFPCTALVFTSNSANFSTIISVLYES